MSGYKLARLLMAILTPEVTLLEIALMLLSWLMRRGPPVDLKIDG